MVRQLPWSRIGTSNEWEVTSARELLHNAGLDWSVGLKDIHAVADDGKLLEIDDKWATVRMNKDGTESVLSVVGDRYQVFQNTQVFESLDCLVESGDARYSAAGELKNGCLVWTVMELPKGFSIRGDEHAMYLLARNSHDGSTAFQIAPIVSRLACTNQMNAAFANARKKNTYYSLKHTINNKINVSDMRNILGLVYEDIDSFISMANVLIDKPMTDSSFTNWFLPNMFPLSQRIEFAPEDTLTSGERRARTVQLKHRNNALKVWNNETKTQENLRNTSYGALHAVVEVVDHFSKSYDSSSARIIQSKDGNLKQRALQLLS
jgi:phage/plasmid-like protein (TIGR03299 family)